MAEIVREDVGVCVNIRACAIVGVRREASIADFSEMGGDGAMMCRGVGAKPGGVTGRGRRVGVEVTGRMICILVSGYS